MMRSKSYHDVGIRGSYCVGLQPTRLVVTLPSDVGPLGLRRGELPSGLPRNSGSLNVNATKSESVYKMEDIWLIDIPKLCLSI